MRNALPILTATAGLLATTLVVAAPATAADVNRPPLRTISGPSTLVYNPEGIARDTAGRLFVGTIGRTAVFPPHVSGDVAPVRTIAGWGAGVAFDADGYLYVAGSNEVRVYAPGGGNNPTPVRTISGPDTLLDRPVAVAVGPSGWIYVVNSLDDSVTVYRAGADGNARPARRIAGGRTRMDYPSGILLARERLYVSNTGNDSINQYGKSDDGNVAPTRRLRGSRTTIDAPKGLATDDQHRLYVANYSHDTVAVFDPRSSGNARPLARLRGPATQLDGPHGLLVDPHNRVVVGSFVGNHVATFPPLFRRAARPGKVGRLKVKGSPRARKWKVDWTKPSRTGHARIDRYSVVVRKRGLTVHKETRRTSAARLTRGELRRGGRLRLGRYKVTVQARNIKGWGPATTKTFRVQRR
ncbi:lactonase family protein with 7-bladed beta-propeller [Mumia flava]|uniref:Lactonase family protein with 7-bladed beta-propeller n=1 Tax=Mumia flava TaxID=1348852 RepID=A0A0B2BB47_9ACTN|nr:NHL repeat-containing protein [Mumia flava]PJJ53897.1 lactonase family protein with 7-bladed beta-propeller [Mumia flava]